MKSSISWLAALLVLFFSFSAHANLLSNPGFETSGGWYNLSNFGAVESEVVYEGAYSLHWSSTVPTTADITTNQKVYVEPGEEYYIGYWFKTDGLKSTGHGVTYFYEFYKADGSYAGAGSWPAGFREGTQDWTNVEVRVRVPENAARISFSLKIGKGTVGDAWYDNVYIRKVEDVLPPNPVTNLTVTVGGKGWVTLSWTPSTKAADGDLPVLYKLYRFTEGQAVEEGVLLKQIKPQDPEYTSGSYVDRGIKTGNYYYGIVAVDNADLTSTAQTASPVSVEEDLIAPLAPAALEALVGHEHQVPKGTVLLKWEAPNGTFPEDQPDFYLIYRSQTANPLEGILVATVPGTETQFLDGRDLKPEQAYNYVVLGQDQAANISLTTSPIATAVPERPDRPLPIAPLDGHPLLERLLT